jgi:hypothetical protein
MEMKAYQFNRGCFRSGSFWIRFQNNSLNIVNFAISIGAVVYLEEYFN